MLAETAGVKAGGPAIFRSVTCSSTPEAVPIFIRAWTPVGLKTGRKHK